MKCQDCNKNPASIHFTQIINGEKREVMVCEHCANLKGYQLYADEGHSLHDVLMGLFNFDLGQLSKRQKQRESVNRLEQNVCRHCETTFAQFQQTGKFGCEKCYRTFSAKLDSIFRRVHSGNVQHKGKIPVRKGMQYQVKRDVERLRAELAELVEREQFEQAAVLRDRIKDILENKDEEDGDPS